MPQLRIDVGEKPLLERLQSLRYLAQALDVALWVSPAFLVSHDCQPFP